MDIKNGKERETFLKNYIQDETWYDRIEQYTSSKFDSKHEVFQEKMQEKMSREPSRLGRLAQKFSAYFGGSTGLQLFFFFGLNIVLATYNFFSAARGLTLWYVSMGTYYTLLAILRFLIMDPKPRCFQSFQISKYWIRRISSILFFLLGLVLPLILFFSLTYFSHTRSDAMMVLVFMIYTIFKISSLLSQFVSSQLQDLSFVSPLNCVTHVELMMALLTLERFWLGNSGDDSFGKVLFLNIVTGIVCILLILFLGIYSDFRAREHMRAMDLQRRNLRALLREKNASRSRHNGSVLTTMTDQDTSSFSMPVHEDPDCIPGSDLLQNSHNANGIQYTDSQEMEYPADRADLDLSL